MGLVHLDGGKYRTHDLEYFGGVLGTHVLLPSDLQGLPA
jgi:hypothetical protein